MVSFTGGTNGGRIVAGIAARSAKPTVMELGGKSPQIVLPDCDLELAVNGIISGIFPAAGQSCISGSRLLIHQEISELFTEYLLNALRDVKVGDPNDPATHIGPIAHRLHYENILKKIETAVKDGYQLILDGRTYCKSDGYYIGPTIFKDISNETDLSQNEIFGPVVSTQSWVEEEEVIHFANDTIYGLAAGIWSKDVAKAMRIADRIEAGTYLVAAAVTKGSITIDGINPNRLMKVIDKLSAAGAEIDYNENSISINMKLEFPNPVDITTAPFPEFPTDMQAQFSVINAISSGTANIYETVFENRFMHILELNRMGCDISVKGNHAVIQGVKSIYGAQVMATDLRASASLILAGLCAEGETVVDRIYHIDRGYERIEEKLNYLGANIIRLPS